MLVLHPIIQISAIIITLYVFCLGIQRFRMLHLKHKVKFNWNRHVILGKTVFAAMLAGLFGGVIMAYHYWHGFLITGTHGKTAMIMLPLILFGLISGWYMNREKKKRKILPIVHGLVNLSILLLAFSQIITGWWVYNVYVLGN
ncbi:MAG: DUF4079 family protein [Deltaproteobacteria bacterium]|nr:DUF4079 family protein [Deltaproteobacteria bacterium]